MSVKQILEDSWSDYDNKKITGGRDHRDFACTEKWEVDYLKNKIKKHHPNISDSAIQAAIESCCRTLPPPHPRSKFVKCVALKLNISEI